MGILIIVGCVLSQIKLSELYILSCGKEVEGSGCACRIRSLQFSVDIRVQVTIYRRVPIGRVGHFDQSVAYDKS